jgi:hypothetical protein
MEWNLLARARKTQRRGKEARMDNPALTYVPVLHTGTMIPRPAPGFPSAVEWRLEPPFKRSAREAS